MDPIINLLTYTTLLLLPRLTTTHFLLNYPPTLGFDDDKEGTSPCGGFTVDLSSNKLADYHVSGDAIALTSTHPTSTWLFRATLDNTASGNWTNLMDPVAQNGLGKYCVRDVVVPGSFVGSKGVIQVVQDAADGFLYQCAPVIFRSGSTDPPGTCSNVTGLSASYTTDAKLASLTASASAGASSTSGSATMGSMSGSSTAASGMTSPSSTAKASEGQSQLQHAGIGFLTMLLTIGGATWVMHVL